MQTLSCRFVLLLLLFVFVLHLADGAEILMITLAGTKSHKIPFWALAKGLLTRGHRVTFVNGFVPDFHEEGLREVTPSGLVHYIGNYTNWDLLGSRYAGRPPLTLWQAIRYPAESCNSLLQDNETLELLTQHQQQQQPVVIQQEQEQQQQPLTERKYHLAIVDGAFPECALGLVHRMGLPFIYINTVGFYTGSLAIAGNPIVYAVTPHVFSAFTQSMHFSQRVVNCITHLFAELLHTFYTWQVHEVLRTHLHADMPHPYVLARNVSFILQNGYATLTYPRPLLPNVAEIACIHCRAATALSGELAQFVEAAPLGVILFSMGSSVRASNMPEQLKSLLVAVFARLPLYHVLWKWENDGDGQPPAVSANVRLSAWLPQQDVLGHQRVKAFITHGGLLSMYEAIYHGVPMVMLPVFCDHDVNAAKAANDGYAVRLPLESLTAAALRRAINEVLHNRAIQRAIRKHQTLLLDQPVTPLETAIFWTEYVIRHKGASHLQSIERHTSFFVYHSLDVLLLCALLFTFIVFMLRRLRRFFIAKSFAIARHCKSAKSKSNSKSKANG